MVRECPWSLPDYGVQNIDTLHNKELFTGLQNSLQTDLSFGASIVVENAWILQVFLLLNVASVGNTCIALQLCLQLCIGRGVDCSSLRGISSVEYNESANYRQNPFCIVISAGRKMRGHIPRANIQWRPIVHTNIWRRPQFFQQIFGKEVPLGGIGLSTLMNGLGVPRSLGHL